MTRSIYLDNNSTTQMLAEVVETMVDCLRRGYLNPASQHGSGRSARRVLENAREQIGQILGASLSPPNQDQVIITSGGTESNNLAIRGLIQQPGEILISQIEHPSALAAANELTSIGYEVITIPVAASGHVDPDSVRSRLNDRTRLVCVMLGNNETGAMQPIKEIADLCGAQGVPLHCDAVQVVGKLPTSFQQLGVTTLSFSAHKFHGPRSVGGLILKSKTLLHPLLVGGSQQLGLRPGTESIASVVGMAKALELSETELDSRAERMRVLRDWLQDQLVQSANCIINGVEPRLPHTLNVSFPGHDRQALVMALDLAGVECSTGSACTSGSSEPSHVLIAMGCKPEVIESSIRLSLSSLTTESDVVIAAERILRVVNNLRHPK